MTRRTALALALAAALVGTIAAADWKLSPVAAGLVREAKARSKWVHMGRVNSRRRWSYAEYIGCDSADGTFLAFGPDVNLPRLTAWVSQPGLDFGAA